jgi:hypothetical protein
MILLAILFPGLSFLFRGKILSALAAIVLQVIAVFTFLFFGVGFLLWVILAVWATVSYSNARAEKRNKKMIKYLRAQS